MHIPGDGLDLHVPRPLPCRIRNVIVPTTGMKLSGRYMTYLRLLAAAAILAKVKVAPDNCLWRKVVKRVFKGSTKLRVRQHACMVQKRGLSIHTRLIGSVLLLSLRPPDTSTSSFLVKRTASKVSSRASWIRNDLASILMIVELSLRTSRIAENGASGPLVKNSIVTRYG
jgi:hypothetical protein